MTRRPPRGSYVWNVDDYPYPDIRDGGGGGWQNAPPEPEPIVIHLPGGKTHLVNPPERERIGYRR